MNHIDTAEMYGNGEAETIVAEANRGAARPSFRGYQDPAAKRDACRHLGSLRAVTVQTQADHIDCYLLH
jgi:aryl-alcohol dehydrogenase-like predicted oxidoreductase